MAWLAAFMAFLFLIFHNMGYMATDETILVLLFLAVVQLATINTSIESNTDE